MPISTDLFGRIRAGVGQCLWTKAMAAWDDSASTFQVLVGWLDEKLILGSNVGGPSSDSRGSKLVLQMADEDFDVASLAAYLHLSPEQVKKMAERSKLPGRRIAGNWRFSRPEIHQWFEARIGLSDEKELDEVEKVLSRHNVSGETAELRITQLLGIECVFVPLLARTKGKVISQMCELTAQSGKLWEPDKMVEAIRNREELHPTALGNGVALMHPRRPMPSIMGDPFLALGVTTTGIPFGGPRGCMTDIFFLIGSIEESEHLSVLARLSRLIQQPELLDNVRQADDSATTWNIIKECDESLD